MKRIVVCCDGTWDWTGPQAEEASAPTNVAKIADLVAPYDEEGVAQVSFYHDGSAAALAEEVGERSLRVLVSHGIKESYRTVASHFTPGDEIWFFGFSRGAYTARSVIGMIRNCGLLRPEHLDKIPLAYELYRNSFPETHPDSGYSAGFRESFSHPAKIRFLGVWETVGRLGVPESAATEAPTESWSFHDVTLSSIVENAYHAVAIDEPRQDYQACLWRSGPETAGEQILFPGVHRDVGGGYHEAGLSDCALAWMVCRARSCGLAFIPDRLPLAPDPHGLLHRSAPPEAGDNEGFRDLTEPVSFCAAKRRENPDYRPSNWPAEPSVQCCENGESCCSYFKCH